MDRLLYIVPIALYALLALDHLIPRVAGAWVSKYGRWIAAAGCAVHGAGLLITGLMSEQGPGFPEALSTAALGAMLAYAVVATGRVRALGLLLAPLSVVVLSTAMVVPSHQVSALQQTGLSLWLPIHLGLIFSGLAGFALAFAVGCLYLFVRWRLKSKKLAGLKRFPSLETLDRIQFRSMLFGFAFLTLGIAAGGAWAAAAFDDAWTLDPKVIFTLVIWAWYGIALQVRLVAGWRGRWSALFSIIGFAGLVFSLIGMNFLVAGWHGYGA